MISNQDRLINTTDNQIHKQDELKKPGIKLIILTLLMVLVNIVIGIIFSIAKVNKTTFFTSQAEHSAVLNGTITGQLFFVILFPLFIVALFQFGQRYRNTLSRVKIFSWSSFVIFISVLNNLIKVVS